MRMHIVSLASFLMILLQTFLVRADEGWQIHSPVTPYNAATDLLKCEQCHVTSPFDETMVLRNPINTSCLSDGCHSPYLANTLDHPALKPVLFNSAFLSVSIPQTFWLDEEDRLNCATCHDPHPDVTEYRPYLLRQTNAETPVFFCQECHDDDDLLPSPHRQEILTVHTLPYTTAHIDHPDEAAGIMDRTSSACSVECHTKNDIHSGFCLVGQKEGCKGHYVGSVYDEKATAANSRMTPREALPPAISLHEGKVGCLSCHSIYSDKKGLLTISNDKSALCLACHRK